jgi:hypothetical protein
MAESALYPIVGEFLKRKLGCFHVRTQRTVTRYGAVDVVGLRQSAGRYGGTAEVIAVEVKTTGSRFLNSAGQAVGYSVMADRCYLAIGGDAIGEEESELASQLNIGLIAIRSRRRCEIVLTSPQYRPLRAQKLTLIRKLGFVECVVCGTLRLRSEMLKQGSHNIQTAAREHKGLRYLLSVKKGQTRDRSERRFICHDCVQALSGS